LKRGWVISYASAGLSLALSASIAHADAAATYSENGRALFSFQVPDFWTLDVGGEMELTLPEVGETHRAPQVLAIEPTVDPTVWMGFLSPSGVRNIDEGRAYLDDLARFLAFDPKVNPPVLRKIGGQPAAIISGTGRRDRKSLQFAIAVVQMPADRVLIAASVVEAGTDPAFFNQLNGIFGSIRVPGR